MSQNIKKTVLVTGSSGFIGSNICRALTDAGYYVIGVDWTRRKHTLQYVNHFLQADFDSATTYKMISTMKPAAVIHCAGYLEVGEAEKFPAKYYNNNVAKTIRLLAKLKSLKNRPVFVFSSSASVYGIPAEVPVKETAELRPINTYGHTKLMVEEIIKDFDRSYGIKYANLRYFNAAGAGPGLGQAAGASHIIPRLIEAGLNHKKFTLNGTDYATADGTCIRDYIHVTDLATAHVKAVEYLLSGNPSTSLNLGTDQGYSNQEIIKQVLTRINVDIDFGPRRPGDPDQLVADATLARKTLSWEPAHSSIKEIVDSAYHWHAKDE